MNVRFYNAGDRIDETWRFSQPEGGDPHFLGYWPFTASKEAWFDVPTEMELQNTTISVQFVKDIKQKFGPRGVVMLDPRWDPTKEDPDGELWKYPLAPTEELVIKRAKDLWQMFLRKVVEAHLADCQSALAAGGSPRSGRGFTARALKLLNVGDPGEQYFMNLQKAPQGNGHGGVSDDVKAILTSQGQMMQTLTTLIVAQASGEKLDAETIKKLLVPVQTPQTLTSGVATGKITKPIEDKPDGLEAYDRKVKPKNERNKAAVAAL